MRWGGSSSYPLSTSAFPGGVEELAPEYPFAQERKMDTYTRALGRGRMSRGIYLEFLPGVKKVEISSSLKRLFDRGYLTNLEVQDTIKLFGDW